VALAAAVVLLAGGHLALWRVAVSWVEDDFALWQAQRRAAGWTVAAAPATRGGWPWAARLDLPFVALAGGAADIPGGVAWRGEQVGLAVSLLRPRVLVVTIGGTQTVQAGALPDVSITADRFALEVPLDAEAPSPSADLVAGGLRVRTAAGDATVGRLVGHGAARPGAGRGEPALSVAASAEAIVLPPLGWPFGPEIAAASVEGVLTGPMPRGTAPARRAASWRDGGGTVEVRRLVVGWGPVGLSGSATLSLDAQLQPAGEAQARIVGAAEAVDALAAARALSPRAAQAVQGVVALLARVPAEGGAPQVDLPVMLRDRTLAVGGFPIWRVQEWMWPGRG
jgi:hypothetical protein